MAELTEKMACDQGDFTQYADLRRQLSELETGLSRRKASARRVGGGPVAGDAASGVTSSGSPAAAGPEWPWSWSPGPRGHGPNLAPASPAAGGFGGDRARMAAMAGQGPLVLTANRQVKRLSLADFPVPVETVDRIRIPGSFSVRSPQHRRDLATTMRNRIEPAGTWPAPRRAADWDDDRPGRAGQSGSVLRPGGQPVRGHRAAAAAAPAPQPQLPGP